MRAEDVLNNTWYMSQSRNTARRWWLRRTSVLSPFGQLFCPIHWISQQISNQKTRKITQIKVHHVSYNLLFQVSVAKPLVHLDLLRWSLVSTCSLSPIFQRLQKSLKWLSMVYLDIYVRYQWTHTYPETSRWKESNFRFPERWLHFGHKLWFFEKKAKIPAPGRGLSHRG